MATTAPGHVGDAIIRSRLRSIWRERCFGMSIHGNQSRRSPWKSYEKQSLQRYAQGHADLMISTGSVGSNDWLYARSWRGYGARGSLHRLLVALNSRMSHRSNLIARHRDESTSAALSLCQWRD
jgi:hypothetical protein